MNKKLFTLFFAMLVVLVACGSKEKDQLNKKVEALEKEVEELKDEKKDDKEIDNKKDDVEDPKKKEDKKAQKKVEEKKTEDKVQKPNLVDKEKEAFKKVFSEIKVDEFLSDEFETGRKLNLFYAKNDINADGVRQLLILNEFNDSYDSVVIYKYDEANGYERIGRNFINVKTPIGGFSNTLVSKESKAFYANGFSRGSGNGIVFTYTIKDGDLVEVAKTDYERLEIPENLKADMIQIDWIPVDKALVKQNNDSAGSSVNSQVWNTALDYYSEPLATEVTMLDNPQVDMLESFEGFDIKDLDGDGIPELIFTNTDGGGLMFKDLRIAHYSPKAGKNIWTERLYWMYLYFTGYAKSPAPDLAFGSSEDLYPFQLYKVDYKTGQSKPLYFIYTIRTSQTNRPELKYLKDTDGDGVIYCWMEGFVNDGGKVHGFTKKEHEEKLNSYVPGQAIELDIKNTRDYRNVLNSLYK